MFLKAASLDSSCIVEELTSFEGITPAPEIENYKCKITVLRKSFNQDLYKEFPDGSPSACNQLEEGQEFITDNVWDPPKGFCTLAWSDLRFMIDSIHAGKPGPIICSCTDGLRPVLFKFERVNE